MKNRNVAFATALCGTIFFTPNVSASDQDLLDTLFQNGVLNKTQYDNLTKTTKAKAITTAEDKEKDTSQNWTSRVKVSGDMRFRQEFRDSDIKGSEKNRTRIRARIGIAAKVNDNVDVGFRLVTAGGTTSTNQTLEGGFGGKNLFIDRSGFC